MYRVYHGHRFSSACRKTAKISDSILTTPTIIKRLCFVGHLSIEVEKPARVVVKSLYLHCISYVLVEPERMYALIKHKCA